MTGWLILGFVLAIGGAALTLIWWRVGDNWADNEHRRFKGPGQSESGPKPTVIEGFSKRSDS